jgi:hypothetical protein
VCHARGRSTIDNDSDCNIVTNKFGGSIGVSDDDTDADDDTDTDADDDTECNANTSLHE